MIICSGTFGPTSFVAKARAAAGAGFDGISIYTHEIEPGLATLLDDLGLSVAEVDGPMAWLPGQPGEDPRRVFDLAAELGARSVTVLEVTGTLVDGAADAFARWCVLAAPLGLILHIEPFPWSGIASVHDAAGIVRGTTGGVLVDTWHLLRGPDRGVIAPEDAVTVIAAQICDVGPEPWPSVRDEAMHGRLPPGPIARSIVERMPAVPLEVEIYSDALHALPPDRIAAVAAAAYRDVAGADDPGTVTARAKPGPLAAE